MNEEFHNPENSSIQNTDIKKAKLWQRGAFVIFGVTLVALFVVGSWLLRPANVLVVKNEPLPVRPPQVNANGGAIIMTVDYCKNSNATGHIVAFLVGDNGTKIDLAWPDDSTKKGCKKFDVPVPIPAQTPTGKYYAQFQATYSVSPIKSSYTEFRTQDFNVINDKLQPGDARPIP